MRMWLTALCLLPRHRTSRFAHFICAFVEMCIFTSFIFRDFASCPLRQDLDHPKTSPDAEWTHQPIRRRSMGPLGEAKATQLPMIFHLTTEDVSQAHPVAVLNVRIEKN